MKSCSSDDDAVEGVIYPSLPPIDCHTAPELTPHILPIVYWPDDMLSKECEDVEDFGTDLRQLVVDMTHTMQYNDGIGLAAPQVGVSLNVIILNHFWEHTYKPFPFINPKLTLVDDTVLHSEQEGCLSVPGYFENRKRPFKIVVDYQMIDGRQTFIELRDLNAFVLQHEIDHLHGKVFVDDFSNFKTQRVKNKIKKTLKNKIKRGM